MTAKHTRRRRIVGSVFILGLVLYIVSLLWLLPHFLKGPINDQLKQNNLHIDYQRLWINPVTLNIHLHETQLKDLSGQMILSADKIDVDWQLWPLLNRHINIDHLFLKQATLYLEFNQDNQLISPHLETTSSRSNQWQFNPGNIEVIHSSVILKRAEQHLPFNDINLQLDMADFMQPQQLSPRQTASIYFKTIPTGDFSIERSADEDSFYWQLNNWPLQKIVPWLSNNGIELTGQLSASGSLQWPPEQMTVIKITETNVTINQLNWPPYQAQQAQIGARDVLLNINTQQVYIGHLNSPGGELTIHTDPLEMIHTQHDKQASESNWRAQLNSMDLSHWAITLQDNHPAVKAVIKQLTVQTESQQQNLAVTFKFTAPFDLPIRIKAHGQISPLQLQGEIKADELSLEVLNPWLQALSPWQIQQAPLSVNSQFCLQNEGIFAQGDWTLSQIRVVNGDQRIDATQTSLQSIGINFSQQLLTLNNINNQSLEIYQLTPDANTQSIDTTNNVPQSTEQLWRVVIDEGTESLCEIKLLQPL